MNDAKITAQELFSAAVKATLLQGIKCSRLRSDGGHRCVVGHLMTEAELDVIGNYRGNVTLMRRDGLLPARFEAHYQLLLNLQCANDMSREVPFREDFRTRAERIARHHGLDMPDD